MAVSTATYISDSTLLLRGAVASGTTDPISASRGDDSSFVLTANPTKAVEYPCITVMMEDMNSRKLGVASEAHWVNCTVAIKVFARNQREKDRLSQQVVDSLRSVELDATTGTSAQKLFGFRLSSSIDIDELEQQGPKSRIMRYNYGVIISN